MTNSEGMTNDEGMTNVEARMSRVSAIRECIGDEQVSTLVIRTSFVIRHSSFTAKPELRAALSN